MQNLKLRLSPVGKRIVMLHKIRKFIKCFKEDQYSKMESKDKKQSKEGVVKG